MPTTVFNDNSLCFYGMSGGGRCATVSGIPQLSPGSSHSNHSWDSRSSSSSSYSSAMSPDTTTCDDGTNRPFLKIVEQASPKFRFRYRSEMQGTHGAIQGEKASKQKKTFPTVKLCNFDNIAFIRCTLYSADENNRHIHAHRLVAKGPEKKEDKDDPHDIKVGPFNNYEACFQTMVIIHTPKKLIIDELVKKKKLQITSRRPRDTVHFSDEVLQRMTREARQEAEDIDMNKVALRFDAFKENPLTGELVEICKPLYTKPIQNMKSHLTSDLKICRIDKHIGSCRGGEEVFIFVEKVSKKNIKVRFFELNEDDEECWCDYAKFSETDVHHQYAIAFRTPPYKDLRIDNYVTVYIQLERPSDKCVSEKIDFQYKPEYQTAPGSKRKAAEDLRLVSSPSLVMSPQLPDTTILLGDIHLDSLNSLLLPSIADPETGDTEMVEQRLESNPSLTKELERLPSADAQEFRKFMESLSAEDIEEYVRSLSEDEDDTGRLGFSSAMNITRGDHMVTDGIGKHNKERGNFTDSHDARNSIYSQRLCLQSSDDIVIDGAAATRRPAGNQKSCHNVKAPCSAFDMELFPQIVISAVRKMERARLGYKEIVCRLDQLFLPDVAGKNGDSILHMAILLGRETDFETLLSICKKYNIHNDQYIDSKNFEEQTPLHLATKLKHDKFVQLLLSYKANASLQDSHGNTPLHYATEEQGINIVKKLVSVMEASDIETRNEGGQTAFHIAVREKLYDIVVILLQAGVDVNRRNACTGDTPLHIAVYNHDLQMVNILLKEEMIKVDIKNHSESTPLMILLSSEDMEAKEDICNTLLEFQQKPRRGTRRKVDQDYDRICDLVKSSVLVKNEEPEMVEVDGELVDIRKKVKQEFFTKEELTIEDVDYEAPPPNVSNVIFTEDAKPNMFITEDHIKEEMIDSEEEDSNNKINCSQCVEDEAEYHKQIQQEAQYLKQKEEKAKYHKQKEEEAKGSNKQKEDYLDDRNLDRSPLSDELNYDDLGDLVKFDNAALAELCPLLDGNGGWKLLAIKLGFKEFLPNFNKHWSPTYLLLLYVDKYNNKSLKDIKNHLVELSQTEAASAVERLIARIKPSH